VTYRPSVIVTLARPASVDRELYKLFQHFCIDREVSAREALERALREFLKKNGTVKG
jgi:hypothetical protein